MPRAINYSHFLGEKNMRPKRGEGKAESGWTPWQRQNRARWPLLLMTLLTAPRLASLTIRIALCKIPGWGKTYTLSSSWDFLWSPAGVLMAWTDSPLWYLRVKSKNSSGGCLETAFGMGLLQKGARCSLRRWWGKSAEFSEGSHL